VGELKVVGHCELAGECAPSASRDQQFEPSDQERKTGSERVGARDQIAQKGGAGKASFNNTAATQPRR